jgi:hypothetical protein
MPTGFIYVVNTVTSSYAQPAFCNVPTPLDDRLYFGPCKMYMRAKMEPGDFIFGVSPSCNSAKAPRRIVFIAEIEERMTFAAAYRRFPDLRGPAGPIHVEPKSGIGAFPQSSYRHIPGSMHSGDWVRDLATPDRDRFFVCCPRNDWLGCWLGACGPEIDGEILSFFNRCSVHGAPGCLGRNGGTRRNPIAHGGLYRGLHLETRSPEVLLRLCRNQISPDDDFRRDPAPLRSSKKRGGCDAKKSRKCR